MSVDTDTATDQDEATVAEVTTEDPKVNKKGAREADPVEDDDDATSDTDVEAVKKAKAKRMIKFSRPKFSRPSLSRPSLSRVIAFGLLPCVALLLAAGAGYLKWRDWSMRASRISTAESVAAAKDGTAAMLSYQPETADKDLDAARDRLTGAFKDSYTKLTHEMVIPGAKQRHISAVATVPAAASVSATPTHAVTLVFVNQTVVVGSEAPSATASTVRVTLDKVNGRWLISAFDPV